MIDALHVTPLDAPQPIAQTTAEKAAEARELIARELAAFPPSEIVVTNSFQAEDMIVLDIVRETLPGVPVVFLDTGYHFAEVYQYRDEMAKLWGMNLISLQPEITVAEQESQFGILNQTDPSKCCGIRKVKPLFRSLEGYRLWFTGLRREQAKSRAALQVAEDFTLPSKRTIRKISPLTEWTSKDVWTYAAERNIPLLKLYDLGYSSIGCEPCTSLPLDPNDPRSGRWGGQKQECGIHLQAS
ncbi:phosphoadenylylsulfate reductase (thioredoxin) [Granulicella rosea]|uniref:Adenosine 5'-phosphosulfate reductase n=1 Tax=Granulicella rosea TaxID=474952 RepID=A0A239CZS7_9BACT|nr:phosphoadenylyl-sulfate reductase [Granulicella rosea]SNS25131.1 phosphoadenylylsulfate reductase (thioredoxin) [Granulicella rosea]